MFLPSHATGLYVILTPDPTWGPRDFQPLFFGEFANGRQGSVTATQLSSWYRGSAGKGVYVSAFTIPEAHMPELSALKQRLIQDYQPICNREEDVSIVMTDQQQLVLKLALAVLGQTVQAQPETKKRSAGFIRRD
jgi:hypothetical protein